MPDMEAEQRRLDNAVERFMAESGIAVEGTVMTGWALVAHHAGYDDGEPISHHPIVYMNGSIPDHTALGLFQVASDIVRGVGRWGRDDD